MTTAENDKTKAVPKGGHVSANMDRENRNIGVEAASGVLPTSGRTGTRFRSATALFGRYLFRTPIRVLEKVSCPEFNELGSAEQRPAPIFVDIFGKYVARRVVGYLKQNGKPGATHA
jgi:hypothetical protein